MKNCNMRPFTTNNIIFREQIGLENCQILLQHSFLGYIFQLGLMNHHEIDMITGDTCGNVTWVFISPESCLTPSQVSETQKIAIFAVSGYLLKLCKLSSFLS